MATEGKGKQSKLGIRVLLLLLAGIIVFAVAILLILSERAGENEFTAVEKTTTDVVVYNATQEEAYKRTLTALAILDAATKTAVKQSEKTATAVYFDGMTQEAQITLDAAELATAQAEVSATAVAQTATAEAGAITGTVTVEAGSRLVGRVIAEGSMPIGDATIRLWRDDGDGVFNPSIDRLINIITTGTGGEFDFGSLEPGVYWLGVDYDTLAPELQALIASTAVLTLQVSVPVTGGISFNVVNIPPTPTPEGTLSGIDRTATAFAMHITSFPTPGELLSPTPEVTGTIVVTMPDTGGGGCNVPDGWEPYLVAPGDTLYVIAEQVGISVVELVNANCLDNPNQIHVGQTLYVPPPELVVTSPPMSVTPSRSTSTPSSEPSMSPTPFPTRQSPSATPMATMTATVSPTTKTTAILSATTTRTPAPSDRPTSTVSATVTTPPPSPVESRMTDTPTPDLTQIAVMPVVIRDVSGAIIGDATLRLYAPERITTAQTALVELEMRLDNRYITPTPAGPIQVTPLPRVTSTAPPSRPTATQRTERVAESGVSVYERMGAWLSCLPSSFEGCDDETAISSQSPQFRRISTNVVSWSWTLRPQSGASGSQYLQVELWTLEGMDTTEVRDVKWRYAFTITVNDTLPTKSSSNEQLFQIIGIVALVVVALGGGIIGMRYLLKRQHGHAQKVFISYRRQAGWTVARSVHDRLSAMGAQVFIDVESINEGRFAQIIEKAITDCDHFVVVLAPGTLESEWVRREVQLAIHHEKNIVPLLAGGFQLDDSMPEEVKALSSHNAIRLEPEFFEAAMDRLAKFVKLK